MFKTLYNLLISNKNQLLWLNTHGRGVNNLHARIDISSKYVTYEPYK